jgi:putative Mg2+ transporter-C (MgtC) family protein
MIPFSAVLLRLILALLLGAIIGAEREIRVHEAGMRTMALVSLGACLFQVISIAGFADFMGLPHIQVDPSRVASYVVAGIGFLGAGSIFRTQDRVKGLTTAATIWTVAAIGLAAGCGLLLEALAATLLTLVVLIGLRFVEDLFSPRKAFTTNTFTVEATPEASQLVGEIYTACARSHIVVENIEVERLETLSVIKVSCKKAEAAALSQTLDELRELAGVCSVRVDLQNAARRSIEIKDL